MREAATGRLLRQVKFQIADLPGETLGLAYSGRIEIDVTAAGHGWFVDTSPLDNTEFTRDENSFEFVADVNGPAAGRIDLLTVVHHELGHVSLNFLLDDMDLPVDPFFQELLERNRDSAF